MFKATTVAAIAATISTAVAAGTPAGCTQPSDSFVLAQDGQGLYILDETTGREYQPHLSAESALAQATAISSYASESPDLQALPHVRTLTLQTADGTSYYIGFAQGDDCM